MRHFFAVGLVDGPAAFGAGSKLIAQAYVGERAAHHHFVISAARAVGVEIHRLHALLDEPLPGRTVRANRSGGRNVVGGDAVSKHRESARLVNIRKRRRALRDFVKEWRILDVRGFLVPAYRYRPPELSIPASGHRPGNTSPYSLWYIAVVTFARTVDSISCGEGQISRKNTGLPALSLPSGSVAMSKSMRPASA